MDYLKLHSEKVRRTSLRVQVRSNHYRKKFVLAVFKQYVADRARKVVNQKICDHYLKVCRASKLRKIIISIMRVNYFEAQWI